MSVRFGIDVSQDHLDLASAKNQDKGRNIRRFLNHPDGFSALGLVVEQTAQKCEASEIVIVLEPTGGHEQRVARWAHAKGWKVCMPNPLQVRKWSEGKGERAKTDDVDARMLARYGWGNSPPAWHPLAPKWAELEALLNLQEQIEKELRRVSNQLYALEVQGIEKSPVVRSLIRTQKHLEKEQSRLTKLLEKRTKKDKELRVYRERALTCPGVGEKLVLPLLLLLLKWATLTEGQGSVKGLVAMVGLDPRPHRSGSSVCRKSKISKMGDKRIRSLLYAAAGGGRLAKNGPLSQFYTRLREQKGHVHKSATTACARKIVCWSWAMFRDQKDFDVKMAQTRQ